MSRSSDPRGSISGWRQDCSPFRASSSRRSQSRLRTPHHYTETKANRLAAVRQRGESYSDAVIRLAKETQG
jgi:hypothetical protein